MASLIQRIVRQAATTFPNSLTVSSNLENLIALVEGLTATDLGLKADAKDALAIYPQAPVTHVSIYEGKNFTMGVFILHPGMAIPLHDHPGMNGICKVLYGSIKLTSFEGLQSRNFMKGGASKYVQVKRIPEKILTADTKSQFFLPIRDIYHSMKATDGPAAFFDILAPPYRTKDYKTDCHYFRELTVSEHPEIDLEKLKEYNEILNLEEKLNLDDLTWLTEVPTPLDYYCNTLEYTGPTLSVKS
ncbi:2-aminoethanethiol dioxygenase isoform X2 [Hydra vulgaris]|uniref:2-aminoethanethiol dioxygenase isoform X2 n=1 Tax=Hydra vulgaris TaxID=6087 RepID=A0ABM4CNY6_HYDVU